MSFQLFNDKYRNDILGKAKTYRIPGMDWQDVAQELDIALWQNLPKFIGRNNATERTFAITVMRNKILDLAKSAVRKKRLANLNYVPLEVDTKTVGGEDIKIDIEDPHWQTTFVRGIQNPVGAIWE